MQGRRSWSRGKPRKVSGNKIRKLLYFILRIWAFFLEGNEEPRKHVKQWNVSAYKVESECEGLSLSVRETMWETLQ